MSTTKGIRTTAMGTAAEKISNISTRKHNQIRPVGRGVHVHPPFRLKFSMQSGVFRTVFKIIGHPLA